MAKIWSSNAVEKEVDRRDPLHHHLCGDKIPSVPILKYSGEKKKRYPMKSEECKSYSTPENSQTGRSALLGTRPSQVLEHTHPRSQTHTLNPTHILLCLVTQNGSCKI